MAARTPLVVIETHEEPRVMALLDALSRADPRGVWTWPAGCARRSA